MFEFENKYYHEDWLEYVPNSKQLYKMGTCNPQGDGSLVVYDGATNYMGRVNKDGSFRYNGGEYDEYKHTFLQSAKEYAGK